MDSRGQILRAPVAQSQDPLQANPAQPETWYVPHAKRGTDLDASDSSLQVLALRGEWRAIAQRVRIYQKAGPERMLTEAAWHILSLVKLRNFTGAAEELAGLGDLNAPEYIVNTSLGLESRVPFALRWLACDIPARLGKRTEARERLYSLLDFCSSRADGGDDNHELWREREQRVVCAILALHLRAREYLAAMQWLVWLQKQRPDDIDLLSQAGYVQLIIGHIPAAETTFQSVVEQVTAQSGTDPKLHCLVCRNKGMLLFAQGDLAGALVEFDAAAAMDSSDHVSANNKAVCYMFGGNLMGAIQSLEGSLKGSPAAMLEEALLANLSSMYELSSASAGTEAKRQLGAWAANIAPDDFDAACVR